MSHNYPYRRRLSDSSELRPDPGPYRPPQESSSRGAQWTQDGALSILSSCGLEPSDLALLAELPEDVLTIESLPQVLNQIKGKRGTIKPFLSSAPSSSSSSSYPHSSAHRPAANPPSSSWDQPHNQPIQYPLDQVTPSPLSADTDRWRNPRTSTCVRADPPSSSSSSYEVDFHHRPGPSEYGKTGRDPGPVSSQDFHHRPGPSEYGKTGRDPGPVSSQDFHHRPGPSEYGKTGRDPGPVSSQDFHHRPGPSEYGKTGRDPGLVSSRDRSKRTRPSRFSQPGPADYRSAPPPDANRTRTRGGHRESETSSVRGQPATLMPSKKEALDFHGTSPPVFPYSCSLCDITVMSEKVWIKHINGTQHADGQLSLLQQFPNWDCRMETISRADSQPEKGKDEGNSGRQPQTANHNSKQPPNTQPQKKASEKAKSKVVCVKFPAQSVDEAYLRKLTEPFGKIVKILMFPSLAFVELGSIDQAKDLVKFHVNYPPTVNGEQMEFRLSNTFSFLQSSRVVSFSPAPSGENGQSDLISIVKRFGEPLYTLFLPSKAFVEMKNTPDAQKLVDYYSSNTLRIDGDSIKVSFSGEYKSLMRVTAAKKYEEESTKSSSREKEDKTAETKRRSSKDCKESSRERKTRTRSRSKDKSSRDRRTRTRSTSREKSPKEKPARSRSRDKSSRNTRTRTRSREKSREKSSGEKRSRSRSRSRGTVVLPEKTELKGTESRTAPDPAPVRDSKPEAEEEEQMEEEDESSADESDIEGMEVIGEDMENLEEEEEEEEGEEEAAERTDSPEGGEEDEEVKDEEADDQQETVMEEEEAAIKEGEQEEEEVCGMKKEEEESETQQEKDEEEPGFPVDLENCITLDELEEEQSEDPDEDGDGDGDRPGESQSARVVYFRNLPLQSYSNADFLRLVRDFGTAVRYFHKPPSCGFIEMSSSSEALRAVKELTRKPITFHGSRLVAQISNKYRRLTDGSEVQPDQNSDERKSRTSSWRSERPNRDESNKKSSERESRDSPKRKASEKKTLADKDSLKSDPKNTEPVCRNESQTSKKSCSENESYDNKSLQNDPKNVSETISRKSPEKESVSKDDSERESESGKGPERELRKRRETGEKDSVPEKKKKKKKESATGKTAIKAELEATEAPEEEKMEIIEDEGSEEETSGPELKDSESSDQPDSTGDPPKPQTEQKPVDELQDSQDHMEEQSGPAGGAAELQRPTKPVGTEFVRPVVGYFCNLCQLIYADEDEAKLQHCSSPAHYRKYQEKTGKDPWVS